MATASSAQREPSMEEILASIRRIIEDSDTGRKQPAADNVDLRQDLQPAAAPTVEVDTFRSELNAESAPRKPVSLAEIQAQLAASDPAVARAEARPEPVKPAPTTLAEVGARVAAEPDAPAVAGAAASAPQSADSIVADWRREIAAVGGSSVKAKVTTRQPEVAPEVEIDEEDLAVPPVKTAAPVTGTGSGPSSADVPPARPAILSEHAGRQVAAAFGELSDAFASRSKKTFDEMAEEMLRPMLQDWLDNNLPTLVERLVREEIERVARGAQ
ncbi:PopZ family protein [Mesorhizobium sp. VK23B]|uniref:PopZ family protein n=1 Tax=Mesorhizobium dulcispinae TaxID=3072316 RepID=A0ABU4XI81_9HYPH|nr:MULTISPECIES: PopZ family protein [unclassified Mesorhizobium]MDX8467920.1 PopZ family protein [Mesorhizobium sp. VK23B]MDX8474258.1 PopZ family protein [Mesorhizobium sp. VK23A]MDX8521244.1 PopZ family protein [Mesorhizobium sp. VK23D]